MGATYKAFCKECGHSWSQSEGDAAMAARLCTRDLAQVSDEENAGT